MASASASFSYAQAAKGQAPPSVSSSTATSGSHTPNVPAEQVMVEQGSSSSEVKNFLAAANGQEGKESTSPSSQQDTGTTMNGTPEEATPKVTETVVAPGSPRPSNDSNINNNSSEQPAVLQPSSVDTSNVSALKEEEAAAMPNGSDSTWERVSQDSQTEAKSGAKLGEDNDDAKLSSWEHVQTPTVQLKEAPLPMFNVWDKRAATAKGRGGEARSSTSPRANGHVQEAQPTPKTLSVTVPEFVGRKRGGTGRSGTEDRPTPVHDRESLHMSNSSRSGIVHQQVVLPPRNDDVSWPTPDSAKEDEKKKPHDKAEKIEPDKSTGRHAKEKWEKMDYVPTAVFNTPLPTARRGGRASRGGRDSNGKGGHSIEASVGGDTAQMSSPTSRQDGAVTASSGRGDMGPPKPGPISSRNKRASSAGPPGTSDPRKSGEESGTKSIPNSRPPHDGRRISSGPNGGPRGWSPSGRRAYGSESEPNIRNQSSNDLPNSRGPSERQDQARFPGGDGNPRERGEGRSERGRGGYRGRGAYNGGMGSHPIPGQGYSGPPSNRSSTYGTSGSQAYPEQRRDTLPNNTSFPDSRQSRHYRAGSRSQPLPAAGFGRFSGNGSINGHPQLSPIQTDQANLFYPRAVPGVMSAVTYPGYMESMQLPSILQTQMEYYFSFDNLLKDTFLRKQMDSQGFVFLHVLQNFNRVKQLTQDVDLVRLTCWQSPHIELLTGNDGVDRVRKARDWQQFVLPMEERDPASRNDGPAYTSQPQFPILFPATDGTSPMGNDAMSPRSASNFTQVRTETFGINGNITPSSITDTPPTETPLSAAVPDFTPSFQRANDASPPASTAVHQSEDVFPDDKIEGLKIMVGNPANTGADGKGSGLAARALSNGLLDMPQRAEDAAGSNPPSVNATSANGEGPSESRVDGLRRSRSPLVFGTAPRQPSSMSSLPALWLKDDASNESVRDDNAYKSYSKLQDETLKAREAMPQGQASSNTDTLYRFWSQFLVTNFNSSMYDDFRRLAFEDANDRGSMAGIRSLIAFYDWSILGQKDVSDRIANDYVELVRNEAGQQERPAFDQLRIAWRNGALPLKNRVKVDKLVGRALKHELEL